jgi:hypothetical protein
MERFRSWLLSLLASVVLAGRAHLRVRLYLGEIVKDSQDGLSH